MDDSAPPSPPRRIWRRRLKRFGIILLSLYVIVCGLLYFAQNMLVFPGRSSQGAADAVVHEWFGERIELKAADETPIVAAYRKAKAAPADAPTILFFYGNAMCAAWCDSIVTSLNDLGCNVLVADYEGYGESAGHASEAGCYATADAAWRYLTQQRGVASDRIVIMGWSLGSSVAFDLASREKPAGLITLSAFTRIADPAQSSYPIIPVRLLLRPQFDNLSKLPNVKCPVLLFHGRQDTLVRPTNAVALAAAFGPQAELVWLDSADHDTMFEAEPEKLHAAISRFLAKVTPTTQPSSRPPALSSSQSSSSSSR